MKKHPLLTLLFFISFVTVLGGAYGTSLENDSLSTKTYLVGIYPFEGDRHGDFEGDIIAVLSDGSRWKVHPKNLVDFGSWQPGDPVHVGLRTSFYFFKREHKFYLENLKKDTWVKVMLIKHGNNSQMIVETSDVYPTATYEHPIQIPVEYKDAYGNVFYHWITVGYETRPCNFVKELYLSDGNMRIITGRFGNFTVGKVVHIGYDKYDSESFLITGTQREAVWCWIKS